MNILIARHNPSGIVLIGVGETTTEVCLATARGAHRAKLPVEARTHLFSGLQGLQAMQDIMPDQVAYFADVYFGLANEWRVKIK